MNTECVVWSAIHVTVGVTVVVGLLLGPGVGTTEL